MSTHSNKQRTPSAPETLACQRFARPYINWSIDRWKLLLITLCTVVLLFGAIYIQKV